MQHGSRGGRRGGAYAHNFTISGDLGAFFFFFKRHPKGREDGWQKASEGSQGCHAEFRLELRTQTRNSRSGRRSGRLLYAPETMNLEGKRDHSSAYIKDENGILLRDDELIRERWVRWSILSSTPSHRSPTRA